jgi:hypothetical protein
LRYSFGMPSGAAQARRRPLTLRRKGVMTIRLL